jgi:hypothetical protein
MRPVHFDPFVSIGAATASIVERLSSKHQVKPDKNKSEPGGHDDPNASQHREYVAHYLRSIDAFERRSSG